MSADQARGPAKCSDCGVEEGALHLVGCETEVCPVCGGQALACYEHCRTQAGRPRQAYLNGPRVPYVATPDHCDRCLRLEPEMFWVSNEEWQANVPPDLWHETLCLECYVLVAGWMADARASRPSPFAPQRGWRALSVYVAAGGYGAWGRGWRLAGELWCARLEAIAKTLSSPGSKKTSHGGGDVVGRPDRQEARMTLRSSSYTT